MLVDLGVVQRMVVGCGTAGHEVVGVCWVDGQLGALKRELDDAEVDGGDAPEGGDAVDALRGFRCFLVMAPAADADADRSAHRTS